MSNVLVREEIDLFYKLYFRLLYFLNKQAKIVQSKMLSPDEFGILSIEERMEVRKALYNQIEYIDLFVKSEDAQELNREEIAIINSWKHFKRGKFFIYKHYKKHSIFLDDSDKLFAVSGIFDPLEEIFPHPPALIETVLIPFKDRIIYDSLISKYPVEFGSGIRNGLRDIYEKTKHKFGIITRFALNEGNEDKKSDVEKLKFYMKNKSNREHHWDEIMELSLKNKELGDLFYQEMGKVNASYSSKQLKKFGLEKKWFGIIDNTVVASGATKDQLQKNIITIVPEDKIGCVYIFKT